MDSNLLKSIMYLFSIEDNSDIVKTSWNCLKDPLFHNQFASLHIKIRILRFVLFSQHLQRSDIARLRLVLDDLSDVLIF